MSRGDSPCSGCEAPRLTGCDVRQCEARCCYDGVYLQEGEEAFLRELVSKLPHLAAHVPEQFVVDGYWEGALLGRKTATRPHNYQSPDFPAHFTRTRCVFADSEGFCELEKFARGRGQHPWTFKPTTCWMFPLQEEDGEPEAPVGSLAEDTYRTENYPGYANFVPCGTPVESGRPWREALAGEIGYLESAPVLPLLGSPGRSVDELLAQGSD